MTSPADHGGEELEGLFVPALRAVALNAELLVILALASVGMSIPQALAGDAWLPITVFAQLAIAVGVFLMLFWTIQQGGRIDETGIGARRGLLLLWRLAWRFTLLVLLCFPLSLLLVGAIYGTSEEGDSAVNTGLQLATLPVFALLGTVLPDLVAGGDGAFRAALARGRRHFFRTAAWLAPGTLLNWSSIELGLWIERRFGLPSDAVDLDTDAFSAAGMLVELGLWPVYVLGSALWCAALVRSWQAGEAARPLASGP